MVKIEELNEHGLLVFKHKTNKELFLERSYSWVDRLTLIQETKKERRIVMNFPYSSFDFTCWEPMTKKEYKKVKNQFREIYKK